MDNFRYYPLDQGKVLKICLDDQLRTFWHARDFPLCNSSQYLARRTSRWQDFLKKAGWPEDELGNLFGVTHEALRRRNIEEAPEGVVTDTEQLLGSAALISLLTQSASLQAAGASDLAARASDALRKLFSNVEGEVLLRGSIAVACPVLNCAVDLRAIAAATAAEPCRKLKKFHNSLQNQNSEELTTFLVHAGKHGLLHSCSLSCAKLLDSWLSEQWETLGQDPLIAKAIPVIGKKTARRLDPTLRRAYAEISASGRGNLELAKRLGAARALEHVKKLPSATELAQEYIAGIFSQRKFLISQQAAAPQISIAMDGSRVGGEKTLVMFATHLQQSWHLWLPSQAVRDFAPQAEHQLCSPGDALQARWSLGLQNFFRDFSEHTWKKSSGEPGQQASETTLSKTRKSTAGATGHERMSSHDLLVCLDNALRSLGLGLASFAPKPTGEEVQAEGFSTALAEEEAAAPEGLREVVPQAEQEGLGKETDEVLEAAAAILAAEAAKPAEGGAEAAEPTEEGAQAAEPAAEEVEAAESAAEEVEAAQPAASEVEAAEPAVEAPEEEAAEPLLVLALDQALFFF